MECHIAIKSQSNKFSDNHTFPYLENLSFPANFPAALLCNFRLHWVECNRKSFSNTFNDYRTSPQCCKRKRRVFQVTSMLLVHWIHKRCVAWSNLRASEDSSKTAYHLHKTDFSKTQTVYLWQMLIESINSIVQYSWSLQSGVELFHCPDYNFSVVLDLYRYISVHLNWRHNFITHDTLSCIKKKKRNQIQ